LATLGLALLAAGCRTTGGAPAAQAGADWARVLAAAQARGGTNGDAVVQAARQLPSAQREGMAFLLENMPDRDLQRLPPAFLAENVRLAYEARAAAPWRDRIPPDLFLNDILPYASVNERRDDWRAKLRAISLPLVADCQTPAEAAHRLNQRLFRALKVRYSTARRRADQGPLETMESGLATCTGLSILLVDACRSVGVPARVVAIPLWPSLRGNHTWVEIWDGDWHFAGAAEPDGRGLNRGWFAHEASKAQRDEPLHAIYASSFRRTGLQFPLAWAPHVDWVSAVNVTDRYTAPARPAATNALRLLVRVLDQPGGRRLAAAVLVQDAANPAAQWRGASKDEGADLNDLLAFTVPRQRDYTVTATLGDRTARQALSPGTNAQALVELHLATQPARPLSP
jgi:hypothetical protein